MPDKYDKAIEFLRKNPTPKAVYMAWTSPQVAEAGCLFSFISSNGGKEFPSDPNGYFGCLTQVRHEKAPAKYFAEEIAADKRIPLMPFPVESWELGQYCTQKGITRPHRTTIMRRAKKIVASLEVFAEWQRKIDEARRSAAKAS